MISERRRARRAALQALFEIDQTDHEPTVALTHVLEDEQELGPRGLELARHLMEGVLENKDRIDSIIELAAPTWPIAQVATTDRVALEMGIYELCLDQGTPKEVAINEAVELAKVFGGPNSAGFVNGVLRSVVESSSRHSHA